MHLLQKQIEEQERRLRERTLTSPPVQQAKQAKKVAKRKKAHKHVRSQSVCAGT